MSTVVILSIGVAIAVVLPIAWRVRQRRFDPFEPIVVFALAWGVMFVVRPIAIVVRDDTIFYGVDIGSTLDKAVLLGLVGAVGVRRRLRDVHRAQARGASRERPRPRCDSDAALRRGARRRAAAGVVALALVLLPGGARRRRNVLRTVGAAS